MHAETHEQGWMVEWMLFYEGGGLTDRWGELIGDCGGLVDKGGR